MVDDRTDHTVMKALAQKLFQASQQNAQLTAENVELTAANTKLTAENAKLTAENQTLKDKLKQQVSKVKEFMQQKRVMLEELEKLPKLETDLTKTQKRNAALALVLTDLTFMLTSLQDEAKQLASALKEAQEPAETRYNSEHAKLTFAAANTKLTADLQKLKVADPITLSKNKLGQWEMRSGKRHCLAYDPEPKASPIDCQWQVWDKDKMRFIPKG